MPRSFVHGDVVATPNVSIPELFHLSFLELSGMAKQSCLIFVLLKDEEIDAKLTRYPGGTPCSVDTPRTTVLYTAT